MANCKDCLHRCYTASIVEEEPCNFFIDRNQCVLVVRCKDCMYHPDYEVLSIDTCLPHKCPMWDNGDDGWGAHWNGHDEGFCDAGERRPE